MWHLKKFTDNSTYFDYLHSDEVWLPRIAYIVNNHIENIDADGKDQNMGASDWSTSADTDRGLPKGGDNKRWVDFTRLGTHFVEFANNGTMYFKDIQDVEAYNTYIANGSTAEDASAATWYRASFSNGVLTLNTPEGDASVYDGNIGIKNFPNDVYAFGGQI